MKVVLSGSTGFIGGEVLTHCLRHPSIQSIVLLSRRELSSTDESAVAAMNSSKVKLVIVKDFGSYDASTTEEIRTADAAIWCIGSFTGDEKIDIEYPLNFINTVKTRPSTGSESSSFRFVYLGGDFTEPPPKEGEKERSLWFYSGGRRMRGRAEAKVMESMENGLHSNFDIFVVRPGAVLPNSGGLALLKCIIPDSVSIKNHDVGVTMVDLAVRGNEKKFFRNQDIIKHAKELRKETS